MPNGTRASMAALRKRDTPSSERPGPGAPIATLKVLVVDDDRVVGHLLADALVTQGHTVAIAHSADEALCTLQERPDIGVVVSDLRMPGGDGLGLAHDVAARLEDARAVSTVLITGHATIEDEATARRLGAIALLRKPCRLAELAGAVEQGLATARRRRGGAGGGAPVCAALRQGASPLAGADAVSRQRQITESD